ncbi:unnamed protein product, partial [Anisakis simplex]|uniref:SSD domain-containing protein n=1 Tax=Anisakis simplex TaxID=6269 RepID=A0A0M3JAG6_ANISI
MIQLHSIPGLLLALRSIFAALGYFLCSTPAVSDFCLLMASGVMLDYFFQITFFASIMVYGGRREATGGLLSSCYQRNRAIVGTDAVRKADEMRREERRLFLTFTTHQFARFIPSRHMLPYVSPWLTTSSYIDLEPFMHRLFGTKYAPFILRKDVMVVSWVLFFAYATLAIYGCSSIAVDISPKKYVRDNSPIQTFVHLADKYIWADNVMPIFYVMKPPDLRNARARARLNELVYRLEHTKYSIGRVSTSFWLWEYQRFLNDFPDIDYETEFYDQKHLSDFFAQFDYKQYRGYRFRFE